MVTNQISNSRGIKKEGGMNEIITSQITKLIAQQSKEVDDLFKVAITKCLGDDWCLADLEGRCDRVRILHSNCETMMLDGKPIIEIYDPELDFGDATSVRSTTKYRMLV